jgi:hypothetical protein
MSRGSYAAQFEQQQERLRVLHLKETPRTSAAAAAAKRRATTGGSATPRVQQHSQEQQQQQQQQVETRRQQEPEQYFLGDDRRSAEPRYEQQHEQQQPQQPTEPSHSNEPTANPPSEQQQQQQPQSSRPKPLTYIAGFPGMDAGPTLKSAGGSGGERTLRHRMFPFHDLPDDGDPHRSMFRPAQSALGAYDRARHMHQGGGNAITDAFLPPEKPRPPPPPRTISEFDKLLHPEEWKHESVDAARMYGTKHQPRHNAAGEALYQQNLNDPHRKAYEATIGVRPSTAAASAASSGSGAASERPSTARPTGHSAHAYDSTRAGWHSTLSDAQGFGNQVRRGLRKVPSAYYSDVNVMQHTALGSSTHDEKSQQQPSAASSSSSSSSAAAPMPATGSQSARESGPPSAGVRVEKRPGSKTLAPANLSLRQSSQVAAVLQGSPTTLERRAAEDEVARMTRALKLNRQGRERDWGQHAGYDIITLAGVSNSSSGGGGAAASSSKNSSSASDGDADRDRAGMSSRTAQFRASTQGSMAPSSVRLGGYTPNQRTSLTAQCIPVGEGARDDLHDWKPVHRPLTGDKNDSSRMWSALQGR